MYSHNKAQQSKNLVHISWDILNTGQFQRSLHATHPLIESTKTISMEDVNTGVLEKVKNI